MPSSLCNTRSYDTPDLLKARAQRQGAARKAAARVRVARLVPHHPPSGLTRCTDQLGHHHHPGRQPHLRYRAPYIPRPSWLLPHSRRASIIAGGTFDSLPNCKAETEGAAPSAAPLDQPRGRRLCLLISRHHQPALRDCTRAELVRHLHLYVALRCVYR